MDKHAIDVAFTDQTDVKKYNLGYWVNKIIDILWIYLGESQAKVAAEETQTHPAH